MSIEELIVEIQTGNTEAKNELWERLRRWVYKLCLRYTEYAEKQGQELGDLISYAWFGMERAIKAYDPEKEFKFITYTKYHICNTISECLGWRGRKRIDETLSLDEPLGDTEDGFTRLDTLEDEGAAEAFEAAEDRGLADWLWGRVDRLDKRQATVLRSYYRDNKSHEKIGESLGVSWSAVRDIKGKALRALRKDKEIRAYREEFAYIHVGVNSFNTTWNSSTELAVLKLEDKWEQMLKENK